MLHLNHFLLRNGVVVMVFLGCATLDSGIFHSCPQGSCNGSIPIKSCPGKNTACQCRTNNNTSACHTLDQQAFVNLTGASNEVATEWTCCVCQLNMTYCCDKCHNISNSSVGASSPSPTLPLTEGVPPIETDLRPMIYAGASILGLVALCVLWQFIKQSWLLSRKKFTPINSDRLDHKTDLQLKQLKIKEAMEENDRVTANGSASSSLSFPRGNVEADKQWPPDYPLRSLKPAYKPTELHNQRTPPRLLLDDEGSDIEDRRSIDSASMSNLDDDTLSDILNSDDERVIRPSNSSPPYSPGYTNPALIEDEKTTGNSSPAVKRKPSTASKSFTPGKGNAKLSVNPIGVHDQREGSIASSNLSLDAGEDTVFLPVKDKKQEKQKEANKFLSPSNGEKIIRRSSATPVVEDKGIRKNSAREVKSPNKSKIEHLVEEKSIKPSLALSDDERRPVTPKDIHSKGKKTTTEATLASPRHSPRAEDIGIRDSESSSKNKIKGSVLSVTNMTKKRNSVSVAAITGVKENSESVATKIRVRSTSPMSGERRKSAAEPARFGESLPEGSRTKANELSIEGVIEDKNTAATDKKKKKKKKEKAEKEVKRKMTDSDDSSEEKMANSIPDVEAGLTAIEHKNKSAASQESKAKANKKKKRKEKERKKRKMENAEPSSDEFEEAQGKAQDLSSDITVVTAKTQKAPAAHDGTQNKKMKKKDVTARRKKSEIAEERPATVRRNGSFVRSTNSFMGDSPDTAAPGHNIPDIPEDWEQTSSSQINTRSQPDSISPISTGHKSPCLVIKP